jgi:hypothetical protein
MATRGTFSLQLSGFPAANRDAQVTLTNTSTGETVTRNPFLDGSLTIRDLDPGLWNVKVTHPNVIAPIYSQTVRLFPQVIPTLVPIVIPPDLFQDTPIRTVPEANLGPVQQALTTIRDAIGPIQNKSPGEVIRASDWNSLASAVRDLAANVLQLTNLISPVGHTHPEIADKIAEVQQNLQNFAQAFGQNLLQLQRELETENLRQTLTTALDQAQASQAVRDDLLGRVSSLNNVTQADPSVFTSQLSNTGNRVLSAMAGLVTAQPALATNPAVQKVQQISQQYVTGGTAVTADSEMKIYTRTTSAAGNKLSTVLGKG